MRREENVVIAHPGQVVLYCLNTMMYKTSNKARRVFAQTRASADPMMPWIE